MDENGFINIDELEKSIKNNTILISIMYANNEIGTIEPINEIGKIAKKRNIIFHTDSVQAIGNLKIDVKKSNIDSLSMSAHKFYGPKGVGALYVRNGISFKRQQDGGHQEENKRSGTENVPGIVGMGYAISLIDSELTNHIEKFKTLERKVLEEYGIMITINNNKKKSLAKSNIILNMDFPNELINKYRLVSLCAFSPRPAVAGYPHRCRTIHQRSYDPAQARCATTTRCRCCSCGKSYTHWSGCNTTWPRTKRPYDLVPATYF